MYQYTQKNFWRQSANCNLWNQYLWLLDLLQICYLVVINCCSVFPNLSSSKRSWSSDIQISINNKICISQNSILIFLGFISDCKWTITMFRMKSSNVLSRSPKVLYYVNLLLKFFVQITKIQMNKLFVIMRFTDLYYYTSTSNN